MGWIATLLTTLGLGGILGALVNSLLARWQDRTNRQVTFRTRQLEELYGPLLSLRNEIRAHSELRVKLQSAVNELYGKEADLEPILKNVKDENETFWQLLMPRYREMVDIFRNKMWLAEPETREHFPKLVEFVSVWDKILNDRLPRAVAPRIGHTEQNLYPFYAHLEKMTDTLRTEVGARSKLPPV